MQCTSFYRDPYEHAAWQLYLRECALRAAREEVAFLEATGGATHADLARIRERVLSSPEAAAAGAVAVKKEEEQHLINSDDNNVLANNNARLLHLVDTSRRNVSALEDDDVVMLPRTPASSSSSPHTPGSSWDQKRTVSLKSLLADAMQDGEAARGSELNTLCRRVRPLLERQGIATFKKHQAVHVLRSDRQRVLDLSAGLVF